MQNKFAVIAMIMVIMIGMTGLAAATQDVTVSIGDGEGNVTIPIMIENVTNLGCCDIWLEFNDTLVNVISVTGGGMEFMTSNAPTDSGRVHIVASQTSGDGLYGYVIVANVTFESVEQCSVGSCGLNLTDTNLYRHNSTKIPILHNIGNGTYTTDVPTGMLNGDANDDEEVDIYDVMYIANYVITPEDYPITCPVVADVDGNGKVTLNDAMYLATHLIDPEGYPLL